MYQNHAIAQALMRGRVAELRRSPQIGTSEGPEQRPHQPIALARQKTGWLLVETGLRLAISHRPTGQPIAGTRPSVARERP